jgi:transketolase
VNLQYIPLAELERIRALEPPQARIAALADACRINTLYMIMRAGSGHIGTSFSAMELLAWLHSEVLDGGDRCFSSKGHDAPGTYAVLTALGKLPFDGIHALRRRGGLPGHPDVVATPGMVTNTGSLGMGVSKARGFVLADRHSDRTGRVFVLTGDGELQEGQFWESLQPTANRGLHEITVIVDHNKLQSDTWVSEVSDLGDLEGRVRAHGWIVDHCDGHDVQAIADTLARLDAAAPDHPKLLIADTVKGRGVSFMEPDGLPVAGDSLYAFHSGAPSVDQYDAALAELVGRLDGRLSELGAAPIALESATATRAPAPSRPQRLIGAYGDALAALAGERPDLVALDGDLSLDTGLVRLRAEHPGRFYECGIAEQDMVSMAGTMALAGLLPVVHSFACFVVPRANEQIYNNATEETKILYAGSLAGIVPGGPGHSHQSVRDIALMGCVPGMSLLEPFCEREAELTLRWAVQEASGPVYLRFVSVPWELGFEPPPLERLTAGRGTLLREGADVLFVTAGPVTVSQAWAAADLLALDGVGAGVLALPWLRGIDGEWLAEVAGNALIVTVDNHYLDGGQGDAVLAAVAELDQPPRVHRLGVTRVPVCGSNDEVLEAHGLDAEGLRRAIANHLARAVA